MKKENHKITAKNLSRDDSNTEEQKILARFHEEESEYQLKNELFKQISATSAKDVSPIHLDKMFTRLWATIQHNNSHSIKGKLFFSGLTKIAAAVIIGLVVGILIQTPLKDNESVIYSAYAPSGSISEIILPDQTEIFLNAESHISYTMNGKNGQREVFLEGEAWFDVKKNDKKNFLVHTSHYDVRVTGTQFNIKSYKSDDNVVTTLEKGEVLIRSGEQIKMARELRMHSGEQVSLNKTTNTFTTREVNVKWFTSWKDNKLIFVNMSLKELVVLLERKYGVDIELRSDKLLDLHFDGTIKNETIIEILEIIQKTLPINYHISGQQIIITPK